MKKIKTFTADFLNSAWDQYSNSGLTIDFPTYIGIRKKSKPLKYLFVGSYKYKLVK